VVTTGPHDLEAFVNQFEEAWADAVRKTHLASALSHQEHLHAGLSGMNFVETLLSQSMQLFGSGGLAERLAPYFVTPSRAFNAEILLAFYKELVAVPILLRLANSQVRKHASRLLGKMHKSKAEAESTPPTVSNGSYNSMDYLRCYSNIMCAAYGAPEPSFTEELWIKMIQCQAKPAETRALLKSFDMDPTGSNNLMATVDELNWTTFLVALCETRQAMGHTAASRASFRDLVERVEMNPGLHDVISRLTAALVAEGATSKHCYCVRLCHALRRALPPPASTPRAQVEADGDRIHMLLKKDFAPVIADGRKIWEGRPLTRQTRKLHRGATVVLRYGGLFKRYPRIVAQVVEIREYGFLCEMVGDVGAEALLPSFVKTSSEAIAMYKGFGGAYARVDSDWVAVRLADVIVEHGPAH
jgi:ASC-1-like (ASCH) protein